MPSISFKTTPFTHITIESSGENYEFIELLFAFFHDEVRCGFGINEEGGITSISGFFTPKQAEKIKTWLLAQGATTK